MPEIVDLDELVPDDITFRYRGADYTIPGDLKTGVTLELYALLTRLAKAEAKGGAAELKRIIGQAERAMLPVFQVHQPDMVELPFGAAGLSHVLRRVLVLIGLLEIPGEGDGVDPPTPAPTPATPRSTRKATTPGSRKRTPTRRRGGSSRSKS